MLLHPLGVGLDPLLWKDWSRRQHRRACMQLLRHQCVEILIEMSQPPAPVPSQGEVVLSRAQRAHARLSWETRFVRNARASTADQVTIKLFGVPKDFATLFGPRAS